MKIAQPGLILAVSFLALSVALPCSALIVFADRSSSSPKRQRFCSPNAEYCVKLLPRPRGAKARLLRRQGRKRYKRLGAFRLVHQDLPHKALVSNDGRHVVTFDGWYSTGYGPNVVVIYQEDGTVTRHLALEDFLSQQEIFSLPRARSIDWSGDHFIREDDGALVLRVVRPVCVPTEEPRGFFDVEIDLETGTLLQPERPQQIRWQAAIAEPREQPVEPVEPVEPGEGPLPIGVTPDVLLAHLLESPLPEYTTIGWKARIQGTAIFEMWVSESGEVEQVETVKALPMGLDQESMIRLRQWRFKPFLVDRIPTPVVGRVALTFRCVDRSGRARQGAASPAHLSSLSSSLGEGHRDGKRRPRSRSPRP